MTCGACGAEYRFSSPLSPHSPHSFGTNPRVERFDGKTFVKHLTSTSTGGLTIKYLASNSSVSSYPQRSPPVRRDGEEVQVVETSLVPGPCDDRSFSGTSGTWIWDVNSLTYVRGERPVQSQAQSFCVRDGTPFIGPFCAMCGAKRDEMSAPSAPKAANSSIASLFQGREFSMRSCNYPSHTWRVENSEKIVISSHASPEAFTLVPGLTGETNTVSFLYHDGRYLRHCGYNLRCHRNDNSDLFSKDATFFVVPSLASTESHFSFKSVNFPSMHIGHRSYVLKICESNDSDLHRNDASFSIDPK